MASQSNRCNREKFDFCILTNVYDHLNSHRIIRNIADNLESDSKVIVFQSTFHKHSNFLLRFLSTLRSNFSAMKMIFRSRQIVTHSPVAVHFLGLLFAKITGKRIALVIWDEYPVTIGGSRFDRRLIRKLSDWLENMALSLSTIQIVPSKDFLRTNNFKRAIFVPFWPSPDIETQVTRSHRDDPLPAEVQKSTIDIAFCGQINAIRALDKFCEHLDGNCVDDVNLHIFSYCSFQFQSEKITVIQHGYLEHGALMQALATMDFGVVSLAPQFDQSAFPSKTFDYLIAGLPVIYFGKDLPHYTDILSASGAGINITNIGHFNLRKIRSELAMDGSKVELFYKEFCLRRGLIDKIGQ